jgi:hypothetical protein
MYLYESMPGDGAWDEGRDADLCSVVAVNTRRREAGGTSRDTARAAVETPLIASRAVFNEVHRLAAGRELGEGALRSINHQANPADRNKEPHQGSTNQNRRTGTGRRTRGGWRMERGGVLPGEHQAVPPPRTTMQTPNWEEVCG